MSSAPGPWIPPAAPFNVAERLILPNLAGDRARRPYMRCEDKTLTYGQLHEQSNRVGNVLRGLGVEPEQRVLLLLLDTLAFPPCFFGTVRIGAVAVPVNAMLRPPDFAYMLEDSRARVLIVDQALWPQVSGLAGNLKFLRHVLIANGSVPGRPALDDLAAQASPELTAEPMHPDDAAFWLYTSGSTGAPKAAVHLHHDIPYVTHHFSQPILGLTERDVGFSAAKFGFAYGFGNSLYFCMPAGGCAVVQPARPAPEVCFATLERFRPTVFYGGPPVFNLMLNTYDAWLQGKQNPPPKLPKLEYLRCSVSAGESLPPVLFERWMKHFGTPILDGIGSTEMLHIFISNRMDALRPGSTGKLVPGYQARLVDEHGQEVQEGETGALHVEGDSAAPYYWNKHERSKITMLGEWTVTGDQFHRDADGFFWHHGRNDDMMKVSGSWVSPVEVENALVSHPAVAMCAVVGRKDPAGLVKPRAFVMLKAGSSPSDALADELKAHVHKHVSGYKVPHWIEFVTELPMTATGKIRRSELRE
jgi:benzoate-CoA ligase